eukprot:scaffold5061_cov378-Prasinococcus_capsulatus_cf.AAC.14
MEPRGAALAAGHACHHHGGVPAGHLPAARPPARPAGLGRGAAGQAAERDGAAGGRAQPGPVRLVAGDVRRRGPRGAAHAPPRRRPALPLLRRRRHAR